MKIHAILIMFMIVAAGAMAANPDGASAGGKMDTGLSQLMYNSIGKGETLSFNVNKQALPVTQIMLTADKKITGDIHIYIRRTYDLPRSIPKLSSANSYFEVNTVNFDPENYEDISFRFRLERQWLLVNRINDTQVSLYRYNGNSWEELPTMFEQADGFQRYYISSTDEFSYFGIAKSGLGETIISPMNETIMEEPEESIEAMAQTQILEEEVSDVVLPEQEFEERLLGTLKNWAWGIIMVVIFYLMTEFYRKKRKKRKASKSKPSG